MGLCMYDSDDAAECGCVSVSVQDDGRLKIEVRGNAFCHSTSATKVTFARSVVGKVEAKKMAESILAWVNDEAR